MNHKREIAIVSCKIIGTVSIGYVAGSYLSFSAFILPAMTTYCPLSSMSSVLKFTAKRWIRYILPFESLAATLLLGAYVLSEPHVSHPYLIYSSFGIASLIPISFFYVQPQITKIIQHIETEGHSSFVEKQLLSWKRRYLVNIVLSGLVFVMTVIGSYGDTLSA